MSESKTKKNILDTICDQRRLDVIDAKKSISTEDLILRVRERKERVVNLFDKIKSREGIHVAAEFKRASPSKGDIATHLSAPEQTLRYAKAGASVISVLTEPKCFKGSLKDMEDVSNAMRKEMGKQRPAVLRKDFILDTYQILEARAHGADTILIIVAAIEDRKELKELIDFARSLSMEPLVEVNSERELDIALDVDAKVIGVNNRNLKTFQVDLQTTDRCATHLQKRLKAEGREGSVVLLALSGVSCRAHVKHYESVGGVSGVLVGEAMMRAKDPGQLVASLLGHEDAGSGNDDKVDDVNEKQSTCVKICGVQNVEDALVAARAGADMIGLIFVRKSKRYVSLENAQKIVSAIRGFRESGDREILKRSSEKDNNEWYESRRREIVNVCNKHRPLVVGVFQNHDLDALCDVVKRVRIDVAQLHGNETPEYASKCPIPTISVLHVDIASSNDPIDSLVKRSRELKGKTDAILLDSRVPGQTGGTGKVFDWTLARRFPDNVPVILAGGLKPPNVSNAIAQARPWCVDVAGGVAREDGVTKDHNQIVLFVERAKMARCDGDGRSPARTLIAAFAVIGMALMLFKTN